MDETILRIIADQNPWQYNNQLSIPVTKRRKFEEAIHFLPYKQIIAIYGLRRVGKSILMKQIILHLLDHGTKPQNIFYFNFEEKKAAESEFIDELIREAEQRADKSKKLYIFFDEIQKIIFWQDIVKRHYDLEKNIKFFISGSSSLKLKKTKESLAGRLLEIFLPPLEFKEFLGLVKNSETGETNKIFLEWKGWEAKHKKLISRKKDLEKDLEKYLYQGAFPELANMEDEIFIKRYIKDSVVDKIIYEDIPEIFKARKKELLYVLLEYFAKNTSALYEKNNLANALGVSRHTVSSHLYYLKHSFLIYDVYTFTKSGMKQMRSLKKMHIEHPAVATGVLRYEKKEFFSEDVIGKYAETSVFNSIKEKYEKIYFWRNSQKNEVDIVIKEKDLVIPVEVKYQNLISPNDYNGLKVFMKEFKVKKGIMVTKDTFKLVKIKEGMIFLLPLWLFLS